MVTVFSSFIVAIVGFALFREHGLRTWPRLRAAGLRAPSAMLGKLLLPALMLVVQHGVLFTVGVVFLDLDVRGSWAGLALVSAAFGALVLCAGLTAAAAFSTVQQVNAVTNVAAMVAGGLGGGFVPVSALPSWVQPVAPVSPSYWAMAGYREVILGGGGVGDVAGPVGALLLFAAAGAWVAHRRLRLDAPKRAWG